MHGLPSRFCPARIFNGVGLDAPIAAPETTQAQAWRTERSSPVGRFATRAPVIGVVGRLYRKGQIDLMRVAPGLYSGGILTRASSLIGPEELPGDQDAFRRNWLPIWVLASASSSPGWLSEISPPTMAGLDLCSSICRPTRRSGWCWSRRWRRVFPWSRRRSAAAARL